MANNTKRQKLEQLIEELLNATPYELVLCELVKAGPQWVVRVFIDKEDGITVSDCSKVSHILLDAFEESDPLDLDYNIEVSSPGIDRPLVKLADYQRFLAQRIYVKLHAPVDGRKVFTGELSTCEGELISLKNEEDDRSYSFLFSDIAKATLKPILDFS